MKVLAIKPIDTGIYKDIFEMFCEGLEKYHGHEVIRIPYIYQNNKIGAWKEFDLNTAENADVIWSPFEPLLPVAVVLSKKFNLPIVGHFEIMPHEIDLDAIYQHWFTSLEEPIECSQKERDYKLYLDIYSKIDVKTFTDEYNFTKAERLLGKSISKEKRFLQPYPFDNEMMEKFRDESIEEKRQIISVFRLVDYKRAQHIIYALSLINNPPKYVIIGVGPYANELQKLAYDLNVDVQFLGRVNDEEKAKRIQESMFSVYPWAWIPIAESAFFKKLSLAYDVPDTRAKMRDMPEYVRHNDIKELASKIAFYGNNKEERVSRGVKAYNELVGGRTDILLEKEACSVLDKILREV